MKNKILRFIRNVALGISFMLFHAAYGVAIGLLMLFMLMFPAIAFAIVLAVIFVLSYLEAKHEVIFGV